MRRNLANILSLVLIIGLLLIVQWINSSQFEERKDDSYWINIAGRQRMLSQKLSKDLLIHFENKSTSTFFQDTTLSKFQFYHSELQHQVILDNNSLFSGDDSRFVSAQEQIKYEDFLGAINEYRELSNDSLAQNLNATSASFLTAMDDWVSLIQKKSVEKLRTSINLQTYISIAIILALLSFAILVFRPRYKETLRQNRVLDALNNELNESQTQLEESIEERERYNNQLQAHSKRLEAIMNSIPEALIVLNQEANIIEVLNSHISGEILPFKELSFERFQSLVTSANEEDIISQNYYTFNHPSFENRKFKAAVSKIKENEYLIGLEDITFLVNLQEDQQVLSLLVTHTKEFIGLTDPNFRIKFINDAGRKMCGLPPLQEIKKMRITEVLDKEMSVKYAREIIPILREGDYWKGKTSLKNLNTNDSLPVESSFFPVKNDRGEILAYGTIQVDISEQVQREREQQQLTEELQASQEELRVQVEELERLHTKITQSENMLNEAQSIAKLGSFYAEILPNKDFRIHWSDTLYQIYGYQKGDLVNFEDVVKIIPEEERNIVYKATELALLGERQEFEHRIITTENELKYIHSMIQPIEKSGAITALQGVTQDITQLKLAEIELKISETRFDLALSGSEDGLFDLDIRTQELYLSPQFKAMLGYEDHEMVNSKEAWFMLIHPEDIDKASNLFEDHLAGISVNFNAEYRMLCKDGKYKWILARGKAISELESGDYTRFIGTHADITKIKGIQQELEEKRSNLRAIIENTADLIWSVSPELTLVTFNQRFANENSTAFGVDLKPDDHAFSGFPEPEKTKWIKWAERALKGEKFSFEYTFNWTSGKGYYDIFVNPISSQNGAIVGVSFFARNVTKRKLLELSLKKQEDALKSLYDTAFETQELEVKLQKAVELGCEFFQMDAGTISRIDGEDITLLNIYPANDYAKKGDTAKLKGTYNDILREANGIVSIEDFSKSSFSNHTSYKNHQLKCLLGVPLYLNGQLNGTVCFFKKEARQLEFDESEISFLRSIAQWVENALESDIYEKELIASRDIAESAAKAKADFLAMMSHEIRTPMNGVLGMTNLLETTKLNEDQKDFVNTIKLSGESLLAIINDILDFSKIESGKMLLEEHPLNIEQTIGETFDLLSTKAAEKDLELLYSIDENAPSHVQSDVTRLRQILINLVSNALKFTEEGEVVVKVKQIEKKKNIHHLQFEVIDTGIGIKPEAQTTLFKAFSQVDSSTTRRYGGTGLGLAICAKLVEAFGGEINVESTPGKGSKFFFSLPCKSAPVMERHGKAPLISQKIWILNPHQIKREVLDFQFRKWGAETQTFENIEQLIDALKSDEPNFLFIDFVLPNQNGASLAEELKKQGVKSKILVLPPLSEHNDLHGNEFIDDLITKPIKFPNILQAINQLQRKPVKDEPVKTQIEPKAPIEKNSLRILLAEDNVFNQKLALLVLNKLGYSADLVANGLEVIEALKLKTYDLILMDIQMPDMGGEEATEIVTREMGANRPAIVAMTANAMEGDKEKYLSLGMNDYISKPINFERLKDVLEGIERNLK